jgi:hypothetical protein
MNPRIPSAEASGFNLVYRLKSLVSGKFDISDTAGS